MMIIAFVVLLVIVCLAAFDYTKGFLVRVTARAGDGEGLRIVARALSPLAKVELNAHGGMPFLVVYFFNLKIYNAYLTARGRSGGRFNGRKFIACAGLSDIGVSGTFGLADPFETGVACAALGAAEGLVPALANAGSVELAPDFLAPSGYLRLSAHARFSLGHTIVNYLKRRT